MGDHRIPVDAVRFTRVADGVQPHAFERTLREQDAVVYRRHARLLTAEPVAVDTVGFGKRGAGNAKFVFRPGCKLVIRISVTRLETAVQRVIQIEKNCF